MDNSSDDPDSNTIGELVRKKHPRSLQMSRDELKGSYGLDDETIDRVVTRISPGVYALGRSKNNRFISECVGRADNDIKDRLKDHVGDYRCFKFEYASSQQAAFGRECELWHLWGGQEGLLVNKNHPARPKGQNWSCPECHIFNSFQARPGFEELPSESVQTSHDDRDSN